MELTINGKTARIEGVSTVAELILARGLKQGLVAVEQNGEIVPRQEFAHRSLRPGDRLEIVHFVGGG